MRIDKPICFCCKYFDGEYVNQTKGKIRPHRCKSFPSGIPREIMNLQFDHRFPHPYDQGFQFELYEGRETLHWVFENASDEYIKQFLQEELEYLDAKRKGGMALPPNMGSNEVDFLSLVKLYNETLINEGSDNIVKWWMVEEGEPPLDRNLLQTLIQVVYDGLDEETKSKHLLPTFLE